MTKGPLDRIAELQQKVQALRAAIAAGKSGDGMGGGPDLKAQLRVAEGELRNLKAANSMFPSARK